VTGSDCETSITGFFGNTKDIFSGSTIMIWKNAPCDGVNKNFFLLQYCNRDYNLTYSISSFGGFDCHETRPDAVLTYLMGTDMKRKLIINIKCLF